MIPLTLWIGIFGWSTLKSQILLNPESSRKCASLILSHIQIYTFFFFQYLYLMKATFTLNFTISQSCSVTEERLPSSKGPLSLSFVHSFIYHRADSIMPQGCSTRSCYSLQSQTLWKSIQLHHHKIGLFILSSM